MKLSFYLFRDTVASIEDAISKSDLQGYSDPVIANPTVPFKAIAFIKKRYYPEAPDSIRFISSGFPLHEDDYRKTSVSCIVFVEISHRVFALPFNARSVLAQEYLEPGFGLKVVVNSIDSKLLKSIDSLKVDNNVLQRKTQVSKNSELEDFEIDTTANWIQAVSGKTNDGSFGGIATTLEGKLRSKTLQGRDSLSFTYNNAFNEIGLQCEFLLRKFGQDTYKEKFGFIDEIKFLSSKDPIIQNLEAVLREKIHGSGDDKIHVVYPDLAEASNADKFAIRCGHKKVQVDYLSVSQVKDFIDRYTIDNYERISIFAVGDHDEQVSPTYSLKDLLIAEIEHNGATFVLANNAWCKIDGEYMAKINTAVDLIEDLTDTLDLPSLRKQKANGAEKARFEKEDVYNIRAASGAETLKFDKEDFQLGGHQKVEICDVLTKQNHFVCVKKMKDSATLSHLFSQGSVSSLLLRVSQEYKCEILSRCVAKWPDFALTDEPYFVYAIPTDKAGRLSQALFFFSKVTLLIHTKEIVSHGHKAALCKIGIVEVDRL